MNDTLHVVTMIVNPVRWQSRVVIARAAIVGWLSEPNVRVTIAWDMFINHQLNPHADLKRNTYGVLEFSGNKPDLERTFDNYLRDREEDSNIIG